MSKRIHKDKGSKTACGIKIREKAPFPYTHTLLLSHQLELDTSGGKVDCKKCLRSISHKINKK